MRPFRVALPKGRLLEPSLEFLQRAGFEPPCLDEIGSRRLVFARDSIEWILVKDCDVPVFVDHGGADAGIAGLDQILERGCIAYQPVTLPYGRCQMRVVAARGAGGIDTTRNVASKYPQIARRYLELRRLRAEVVHLGGSVELAAVLGLTSHVIDLVETGETVRANDLCLQEVVAEICAQLIVGRDAYRTNRSRAQELIEQVARAAQESTAC